MAPRVPCAGQQPAGELLIGRAVGGQAVEQGRADELEDEDCPDAQRKQYDQAHLDSGSDGHLDSVALTGPGTRLPRARRTRTGAGTARAKLTSQGWHPEQGERRWTWDS